MKAMTSHDFEQYVRQLRPSGSLKKRLTTASLAVMADKEWANSELVAIATKDGGAGIVFVEIDSQLYGTPYELSAIRDQATGRSKSIICDFCSTWQAGVRASTITFRTSRSSANAIGFLCCADLKCSLHVRDLTESSKTSRSQLREDITPQQRVQRLQDKLQTVVTRLNLVPLTRS